MRSSDEIRSSYSGKQVMPSQVQIRALSVAIPVSFHRLIYRKIRSDLQEGSSALLQPQVTSIIHIPTHVGCGERFLLLTHSI